MKQTGIRHLLWASLVVIVLLGLAACAGKSTPPGASFVFGQVNVPEGFGGSIAALRGLPLLSSRPIQIATDAMTRLDPCVGSFTS